MNKNLFCDYDDKIIHIVVDDDIEAKSAWDREHHQRKCIDRGLQKLYLNDDDIVIISDADEIPDSKTLKEIKQKGLIEGYSLHQDLYYYNLNTYQGKWNRSKILPYRLAKCTNPQKIRDTNYKLLPKGGWHFSYFGDSKFIKNKIENFSHQEYNNKLILDNITDNVRKKRDLFDRKTLPLTHKELKDNDYLPQEYKMLLSSDYIFF